jgi:hypothetical protein
MGPHKVFAGHIFRIINKLIFLEKKSMLEFEGVKLYPSELHLIDVINDNQTANALDRVQLYTGAQPAMRNWSPWVKFLRWAMTRLQPARKK